MSFIRLLTHPQALSSALCGLLAIAVSACSSATMGHVGTSDELPKELSKEQIQKFEVQDTVIPVPAPSPSPSPAPEATPPGQGKKRERKRKKKAAPKAAEASDVVQGDPGASTGPLVYPSRRPPKDPIWIGEKLVFTISYFGMSAGDFTLEAMPLKAIDNRQVYHIKGKAESSAVFNLFYRLNDTVESFIDFDGIFSHRFHILLDETKQSRDSLELNDPEKAQTFYWNRWKHKDHEFVETKEFAPIQRFSQDSLSAMYYLRTVPLKDGDVVTVPVVSEGKSWEAVVTVIRRETMRTPMGRMRAIVLKPETKYQGVLKKQGDSYLWLTDDDRRVPIRLEAKVRIGTVVANLKIFEPGTPPASP